MSPVSGDERFLQFSFDGDMCVLQITLQDYRFSFKFKESCKTDVMNNCKGSRKK